MMMQKEKTVGKAKTVGTLFSGNDLKKLIFPLIIEQILAVSVGMVDTMMVSSAGEAATSGVSLVDIINVLIINIFAAVATGGAVVASQYLGQKRKDRACQSADQLILVTGVVALVIMTLSILFRWQLLNLIYKGVTAEVMKNAVIYLTISAISYPFLAVYNSCAALFRSMGNSKVSMKVSLAMNAINVAGNALCVFGLHMGVEGVAIPTLVSRMFAAVVMVILVRNPKNSIRVDHLGQMIPQPDMIRNILAVGIPSGLENGMFQIGKLSVSSLVSTFGTAAIAANSVANSVTMFANIPGNAIGMAMITVIGQCIGAKKPDEAKRYGKKLMFIAYAGILATNIVMTIVAVPVVGLFHLSPEATKTGLSLIHCFSIVAIFIWPLSFTMPNALRAAGDAKYTMMVSIFSMWAFRVGSSYLLGGTLGLGVLGVWFGMFIDWGFRSLAFLIRFIRGKWTQKAVI